MHRNFLVIALLLTSVLAAQEKDSLRSEGMFAAIIVEDMAKSLGWYSEVLDLRVNSSVELPERGLKQANLGNGELHIELIELDSAVRASEVLKDTAGKTRISGIFKIGFRVRNFDSWERHLTELKLISPNEIVIDPLSKKKMILFRDPDGNRIQLFEN